MKNLQYAIFGAGGFSREIIETIKALHGNQVEIKKYADVQFIHGENNQTLSSEYLLNNPKIKNIIIAIGDSSVRQTIAQKLDEDRIHPLLRHPTSIVGSNCLVGTGSVLQHQSILTTNCSLGKFSQINLQVSVGHDCKIGDFFTASPKSSISGSVRIGDVVTLGTGAIILPNVSICSNVTIGAGAVVTKNIVEPGVYVGVPARKLHGK